MWWFCELRALETKQKKKYSRLKGWWDPWSLEKFKPWVTQSYSEKRRNIQELFPIHIRNISEILSVDPPIFRQYLSALTLRDYNQTLLYGHPLVIQTPHLLLTGQFALSLGKKVLIFSLNSTPLNTNTLLTLSLLGGVWEDDANFIVYCFVRHKLYKAKKNYLNSHSEEAQEKPPGL